MYRRRNSYGFTLIEVMVATLIVLIVSGAIYGLTGSLVRLNAFADQVSHATVLGQNKIEELRGLPPGQIVAGNDSVGSYLRGWSVVTNTTPPTLVVTVTVGWQKVGGGSEQTRLKAIISE